MPLGEKVAHSAYPSFPIHVLATMAEQIGPEKGWCTLAPCAALK